MSRGLLVTLKWNNLGQQDVVRVKGTTYIAVPRDSGSVRLYPFRNARRGCPFSRPVPKWITERKEELSEWIYG